MKRRYDLKIRNENGRVIIFDPLNRRIYSLDNVGAFIWKNLGRSAADIVKDISKDYKISRKKAMGDFLVFLRQLEKKGLVSGYA